MRGEIGDRLGRRRERHAAEDGRDAERGHEPAGGALDDPDKAALEALHLAGV
ncbi:MAG: hypothetical protein JF614_33180 [Acidobacteria bacterium]|nr:hypothetical protein [Acidobacteriota bacterium]